MGEEEEIEEKVSGIGFNIQVSKQTTTLGSEVVTITTNAPKSATGAELYAIMQEMFFGIDERVKEMNEKILKRQEELGIAAGKRRSLEDIENEDLINGAGGTA